MPGVKRQLAETGDDVHASRKRRVQYSEADAQLATIYNELADEAQAVRLKAAGSLLKILSKKSPSQTQQVDGALTRLIKGLCSGRKAARLGFSVALSEVLRLAFDLAYNGDATEFRLGNVTEKVAKLTQVEGNVSGQEKREHSLGQRFAFQAILQSNVVSLKGLSDNDWEDLLSRIADLATQKPWLRTECGAMLYEYLSTADGKRVGKKQVQMIVKCLQQRNLLKTPEGVAIWLLLSERFPKAELPKGVWDENDPLCSSERTRLKKVLHGTMNENEDGPGGQTGSRQAQPSFAWKVIFSQLYTRKQQAFESFWDEAVENGLFSASSSTERKAMGLQIVSIALATAPTSLLKSVLRRNIVHCIINQRADTGRYLFEAAKVTLNQVVVRAKADQNPNAGKILVGALFDVGGMNFDHSTKTKTIETILHQAEGLALVQIVSFLQSIIISPGSTESKEIETRRRSAADLLLTLFRSHQEPAQLFTEGSGLQLMPWLDALLASLVTLAYCEHESTATSPVLTSATVSLLRTRLSSCLGSILQHSVEGSISAVAFILKKLRSSQTFLQSSGSKETRKALKQANKQFDDAGKVAKSDTGAKKSTAQAYQLLFGLSILQVYNEEPEAAELLEDLGASYSAWQQGGDATSMVIEILLSFIAKPSALFRKLGEQVFSTFSAELTPESMQSLLDILTQKESLSGQQELFKNGEEPEANGDEIDEDDEEDDDAGDAIDVEDESDVELVNGEIMSGPGAEGSDDEDEEDEDDESSESDSSADSDEDDEEDEDENEEDEETIFDRKLAEALGTAGMENDSDDDGSDMDDDQMMELEPHLASIFRERSKQTGKKQESKDAKENIINFKNRVLDLLNIYVKRQHDNVLALDLVHPLTMVVRTTTSKPTAEKAFAVLKQYFESCNKSKNLPVLEDEEAGLKLLEVLHAEMKLDGSKLHANACSRASLFLSKVLVAMDAEHFKKIASMYAELQSEWYLDAKSKVQGSIFTEWTSWALATRKQK
ncbi:Hypothetical protein R9X50_00336200 [Acrodontium crateriforme]|uniref:DNA polymerase V n=1 Tax=Acrodontium crateriforme TaxID=150365 RepID=A0AAQ3M5L0_9PEZI|nr:Hypothetical protein R9X50_00336200 [Acrodontium crateriforme]